MREFRAGGEGHVVREAGGDDAAFGDYLFMRTNPKGVHAERWVHIHGCRRWFNMIRRTDTDRILAVYKVGEPRPAIADETAGTPSGAAG